MSSYFSGSLVRGSPLDDPTALAVGCLRAGEPAGEVWPRGRTAAGSSGHLFRLLPGLAPGGGEAYRVSTPALRLRGDEAEGDKEPRSFELLLRMCCRPPTPTLGRRELTLANRLNPPWRGACALPCFRPRGLCRGGGKAYVRRGDKSFQACVRRVGDGGVA